MNPFYFDYNENSLDDFQSPHFDSIKKKRFLSTQYSFKTLRSPTSDIDKYLNLDSQINITNTHQKKQKEHQQTALTKQEITKMRNKINAQRYRDKKKNQFESVKEKVTNLEKENKIMKQCMAYCQRCKGKIEESNMIEFESTLFKSVQINQKHRDQTLRFQKPIILEEDTKKQKGKLWIALAIIMLVMGLNVHGFNKTVYQFKVNKQTIENMGELLKNKQSTIKIPIHFQEKSVKHIQQKSSNQYLNIEMQGLSIKTAESDEKLKPQIFEIRKEFIRQLQSEINQIGKYL